MHSLTHVHTHAHMCTHVHTRAHTCTVCNACTHWLVLRGHSETLHPWQWDQGSKTKLVLLRFSPFLCTVCDFFFFGHSYDFILVTKLWLVFKSSIWNTHLVCSAHCTYMFGQVFISLLHIYTLLSVYIFEWTRERQTDICWFTFQMPAATKTGPRQSQELRTWTGSASGWERSGH